MLRQRRLRALAIVAAGLLAGIAAQPAAAQQDATQAPAAAATTPAQPEPSPEQLATAVEFLKASGLTSGFDDIIPQFLTQASQIYANQRPELRGMINDAALSLVPEFVTKRNDLDLALARYYTKEFSEDELKQLVAFYQTPVGIKFSKKQQEILRDSVPVVGAWTRELQDNIMRRLREEVAKRGGQLGGPVGNQPDQQGDAPAAGNTKATSP